MNRSSYHRPPSPSRSEKIKKINDEAEKKREIKKKKIFLRLPGPFFFFLHSINIIQNIGISLVFFIPLELLFLRCQRYKGQHFFVGF
jgi:hypothetical protein